MSREDLLESAKAEFEKRKFSAGVMVALIDMLAELDAFRGVYKNFSDLRRDFPQETVYKKRKANTLFLRDGETIVSLRPFYNVAEALFRETYKRFDYPNCAPHATQSWIDYISWIDGLLNLEASDAQWVREKLIDFVLEQLPSHEIDPSLLQPLERHFTVLLEGFETSAHHGEPQGAVFQGMIYAYLRADAPHLHLEVAKVGAGSKRLQRVGDIDGWEGERLILTAEVKSYEVDDVAMFTQFSSEAARRKALGIVAAIKLSRATREGLIDQGIRCLDKEELVKLVDFWDPLKQRAALSAFEYYVHHIEKNGHIKERLREFKRLSIEAIEK